MYFALVRLHKTHNLVNFKPRFLLSTIAPVWRGALTILFDPCFQDEGLIFATDFHPILARGRPVDPESTPNMGQMRSRWEMATPLRLASTIQPIHETVTNRSANSNSDEDVSNNQDVIERLTRAMMIRRGWRQR